MYDGDAVTTPVGLRVLFWALPPVLGAAVVFGVERLADVVVEWRWVPWKGLFRVIHEIPEPWATGGALVVGALLGLVLAAMVDAESLAVRVDGPDLVLTRPGVRRVVPRGEVVTAFRDKGTLVLLGRNGRELAREPSNTSPARVEPLLRSYGIAWAEKDPFADAYQRWVPDSPEVSAAANAVFAARQKALESDDDRDVAELREVLAGHGYVVRDERKKQYWRQVGQKS
ncbi:hypothetical protein [Actinoplanes sp. NPDC089786]|uniref:YqeB family protein n=1 Tax=Actinoplanes sp. NPDC089786 TaxID=3155185 RepID=UPI003417647C